MLLITDDFNGAHRAPTAAALADFVASLATIGADRIALDVASPDLTNYPSKIGTENPSLVRAACHHEEPDPMRVIVPALKGTGAEVLANLRMNDHHGKPDQWAAWEREHTDWSLGVDSGARDWKSIGKLRSMDYAIPEVREHRLSIVEEFLSRYGFDGVQLDFSRTPPFLSNPKQEHARFLTEFVSSVRALVDASPGRSKRLLGAIVPWDLDLCRNEGLEIENWIREGLLDYLSPGEKYYADWNIDLAPWVELTGGSRCSLVPITHGNVSPYQDFEYGEPSLLGENHVLDLPKLRAIADNYLSQGVDHFGLYNFYTFDFGSLYPELRNAVDQTANRGACKHWFVCRRPRYVYREYLAFDIGVAFARERLMDAGDTASFDFRFARDEQAGGLTLNIAVKHLMPKDRLRVELDGNTLDTLSRDYRVVERKGREIHTGVLTTTLAPGLLATGWHRLSFSVEQRAEFREPLEVGEFEIWSETSV